MLKQGRYIFKYLRPFRVHFASLMIYLVLMSLLSTIIPYLTFTVIVDRLLPRSNFRLVFFYAGAVLAFVIVTSFVRLLQGYLMAYMASMLSFDIRQGLFRHLQKLSLKFFVNRNSGEILERLNTDVEAIQTVLTNQFVTIISSAVQVFFLTIAIFIINWQLAVLILVLVGFEILFLLFAVRRLHKRIHAFRQSQSKLIGLLQERISLIRVIQAFVMQRHEKKLHRQHSMDLIGQGLDIASVRAKVFAVFFFFMDVIPLAVLWLGSYLVVASNLTVGALLAMWAYSSNFLFPIRAIVMGLNQIQESVVGVQRVKAYLDERPEITEIDHPVERRVRGDIRFDGVDFSYEGDRQVLFDVDLQVKAGETVAFVGESGSGKSTITNLLYRFYDPTAGRVLLDGIDLREYNLRSLRRSIGVVFQETDLFAATLRENLAYGVRGQVLDEAIMKAARMALLEDVIERLPLGLDTMLEERGANFSGGERQRIAICRLVLKRPDIVVFDEATSALDSASEKLIQEAIERVMREPTSILIAHRLSTVIHADRIYVMRDGRIVEEGRHDELLRISGEYRRLWDEQLKAEGHRKHEGVRR